MGLRKTSPGVQAPQGEVMKNNISDMNADYLQRARPEIRLNVNLQLEAKRKEVLFYHL